MKIIVYKSLAASISLMLTSVSLWADTPPTISPSTDQYVLIDTGPPKNTNTVTLTASAGTLTTKPPGDCGWTPSGQPTYTWNYSGLTGTPKSGVSSSQPGQISFPEGNAGQASVTITMTQKWTCPRFKHANQGQLPTTTVTSAPVVVKVQVPTTLSYVNATTESASGGTFHFTVGDQDGVQIKAAGMILIETETNIRYTIYKLLPPDSTSPPQELTEGTYPMRLAQPSCTSDASGALNDTGVGLLSLGAYAVSNSTNVYDVETLKHYYGPIKTPDGKVYQVYPPGEYSELHQAQTIMQKGFTNGTQSTTSAEVTGK